MSSSLADLEELLYELQANIIKLEIENKTLRESQIATEKSRERYVNLYEFAPIGYLILNQNAQITEINITGEKLLGEARNTLINVDFSNFISPEKRDHWHQLFFHTFQYGTSQMTEIVLQRRDGFRFDAQLDSQQTVTDGNSPMVRVTLTDISKRHQAQSSERKLRHILDNTLDMIFIFSPDTLRFEYMNKGAIQGIGYSQTELLQMTPLDILLLISEPESRAFIAPLISGDKKMRRFEVMARRKDGKGFPVEVQLQLIKENNDDEGMFVAIVRDITRRKLAERTIRQQKNLMWQVIDMDPNMIFVKDEAGSYLLANRMVADYYGVPIQMLIGMSNNELNSKHQPSEDFFESNVGIAQRRRELVSTESLTLKGKQHWFRTFKRPLPQPDGSVNTLGIAVDISDMKLSEMKLAESYKELQRLTLHLENVRAEERAQIARNLHDEMGATLAALKMRIAWLASKLPSWMPHLINEVEHMSDLVSSGVKTVRQVVTNLRPNLLDDVGLEAAIKDYVKKFQRDTEIKCILNFPDHEFVLNEDQSVTIFRIIQESLNNVVKHSQASEVEITFMMESASLLLRINDNGIGFEPLKKQHSYGLLGIKERALMICGTATITSTPRKGTSVAVSIPINPV